MLANAKASPDFVNYLTYLLSTQQTPSYLAIGADTYYTVRYSAAINLKNLIKTSYKTISPQSLRYIHSSTLQVLQDPNPQIRRFAGTVITEIVQQGGVLAWPQVLQELMSLVDNTNGRVVSAAQEGAMSALSKVCEDNRRLLDKDFQGQRPLDVIIPKLLDFTNNSNPKVRSLAVQTLKVFIPQKPRALNASLDTYLQRLFQLANDPTPEVRRSICQTFVSLIEAHPESLAPHLGGLVDYILTQQQNHDDPELSLDAAEFWLSIGEQEQLCAGLGPYLHKVIPVLLQSMIYDEEDVERLTGGEDDADEEDKIEDIRPQFAKQKGARTVVASSTDLSNGAVTHPQSKQNGLVGMEEGELSEGEIEEDEGYGEGGDPEDPWSLRKCSAAALDVFATVFHQPVFEIILPYLKENLAHSLWPRREAAVLALGAIAEGCMDVVKPHLPELVPFLISLLSDPEPVVRQITCWCLGRYSEWASHLNDQDGRSRFFEPTMEGILNRMLDNNKRVQEAAASAFASLEEKSGQMLVPYTEPILRQFVQCFEKYKDRNMYILYDCVQSLAENVSKEIARPELVNLLMPALIGRWNTIADQSREMFPLLECLGFVANAYGESFAVFSAPIFDRCIKIIYQNLQQYINAVENISLEIPDSDFLVTSLDLLSAIIQSVDSQQSGKLVAESQPQFFDLLAFCMEDPNNDVRQSSYALLGDCAMHIATQFQPFVPRLLPLLTRQLDLDLIKDEDSDNGFSVINNACWSCGEIGAKALPGLGPHLEGLYQGLIAIMENEEVPDSVDENAAIALGRLGVGYAEQLAPHLQDFAGRFLESMAKIDHTPEKTSAFLGFNRVVERNPRAMETFLGQFFTAIASFPKVSLVQDDSKAVLQSFQEVCRAPNAGRPCVDFRERTADCYFQIIRGYKDLIPDFSAFLGQLPSPVQQKLRSTYQL